MEPHFWHEYYASLHPPPPHHDAPSPPAAPPASDYTVLMRSEDGSRTAEQGLAGARTALDAVRLGRRVLRDSHSYAVGVVRYRGEPLCGWPVVHA